MASKPTSQVLRLPKPDVPSIGGVLDTFLIFLLLSLSFLMMTALIRQRMGHFWKTDRAIDRKEQGRPISACVTRGIRQVDWTARAELGRFELASNPNR